MRSPCAEKDIRASTSLSPQFPSLLPLMLHEKVATSYAIAPALRYNRLLRRSELSWHLETTSVVGITVLRSYWHTRIRSGQYSYRRQKLWGPWGPFGHTWLASLWSVDYNTNKHSVYFYSFHYRSTDLIETNCIHRLQIVFKGCSYKFLLHASPIFVPAAWTEEEPYRYSSNLTAGGATASTSARWAQDKEDDTVASIPLPFSAFDTARGDRAMKLATCRSRCVVRALRTFALLPTSVGSFLACHL